MPNYVSPELLFSHISHIPAKRKAEVDACTSSMIEAALCAPVSDGQSPSLCSKIHPIQTKSNIILLDVFPERVLTSSSSSVNVWHVLTTQLNNVPLILEKR